ncbi:hypothetical protein [Thermus islandicus]|uniref:hypothetical protein n=1 Tax=Thermus islandicus TaxID=540988 RepID=UPI0034E0C90E
MGGLGLADTLGRARPEAVHRLVLRVREAFPHLPLRVHLHEGGCGLENARAALEAGATALDATLGGSPFAGEAGGEPGLGASCGGGPCAPGPPGPGGGPGLARAGPGAWLGSWPSCSSASGPWPRPMWWPPGRPCSPSPGATAPPPRPSPASTGCRIRTASG